MSKLAEFLAARLWTIFTTLAVVLVLMMLWLVTPSTILFRPIEWVYDPASGTAAFTRVVNSDREITVRWSHIIYTPEGACPAGGVRPYDARIQTEIIQISDELQHCLDHPQAVAVLSWSPLLFGIIPLRPFTMTVPAGAEIPHVVPRP